MGAHAARCLRMHAPCCLHAACVPPALTEAEGGSLLRGARAAAPVGSQVLAQYTLNGTFNGLIDLTRAGRGSNLRPTRSPRASRDTQ